jgi:hypothetical protein
VHHGPVQDSVERTKFGARSNGAVVQPVNQSGCHQQGVRCKEQNDRPTRCGPRTRGSSTTMLQVELRQAASITDRAERTTHRSTSPSYGPSYGPPPVRAGRSHRQLEERTIRSSLVESTYRLPNDLFARGAATRCLVWGWRRDSPALPPPWVG